jgi:hypothetical protein
VTATPAGPLVSVELDVDDAVRALGVLRGDVARRDDAWVAGRHRVFALVDLGAAPPGWVALAVVDGVEGREPIVTELLVGGGSSGSGVEQDLLSAVISRLRASGAVRLRIAAGVVIDL